MNSPIRILLADDHPIFRSGLRALIEREPGFAVVAVAADGEHALAELIAHRPDVALLDLDMPKKDAFGVMSEMASRGLSTSTAVVVLTAHRDEALVHKACDLGVRGYLVKDGPDSEIIDCIRAVYGGRVYISPRVSGALLTRQVRTPAPPSALSRLTPTERRVLAMIADQQSTKQIADALFISVRTVDRHRSNLCTKLDLHGTNALTKYAIAQRAGFS